MKKEEWKKRLEDQIRAEGLYKSSFDITIEILSEILEERDEVYRQYLKKREAVVDVTTDRGSVNKRPNPLLNQWKDLNSSALQYIKELGLSPAGAKKIKGETPAESKPNGLEAFMREFEVSYPTGGG